MGVEESKEGRSLFLLQPTLPLACCEMTELQGFFFPENEERLLKSSAERWEALSRLWTGVWPHIHSTACAFS